MTKLALKISRKLHLSSVTLRDLDLQVTIWCLDVRSSNKFAYYAEA